MTIQEAKKLIRKAHFSADKPLDSLDLAVEKIYAELFGITEQMEAELTAHKAKIEELEKSRLRWLKLSDEFNAELKAKDQEIKRLTNERT